MTKEVYKFEEIPANCQLCYVEEVPETYMDYDEESKQLMQTPEYKEYLKKRSEFCNERMKTYHSVSCRDLDEWERDNGYRYQLWTKQYDHPDYEAGYTHYLYFTDDFEHQWGDDWDDAPFEHNAGTPDDSNCTIYKLAVQINHECNLPNWNYINSPYSVKMINAGAVAWLLISENNVYTSIHGGDDVLTVEEKLQ